MNISTVALGFGSCFVYIYVMSALGRLLAACREQSSVPYLQPAPHLAVR